MYNVRPRMGWTTNWLGVEAQGSKWKSRGAAEIEGARVLGYVALDAHSSCLIAWKGSRVLKPTRPFGNVTRCCMARLLMLCLSQSICSSHHVTAQAGVFALLSSLLVDGPQGGKGSGPHTLSKCKRIWIPLAPRAMKRPGCPAQGPGGCPQHGGSGLESSPTP